MTTPAEYRALADRAEAGADIQLMIVRVVETIKPNPGPWEDFSPMVTMYWRAGAYLDAVEALRVAKLPGWHWYIGNISRPGKPPWLAELYHPDGERVEPGCYATVAYPGRAPTEPAARLAAVLRAMAAQMEADDAGN